MSVILTVIALFAIIIGVYWILLIMSITTGLLGLQALSLWFRGKMDSFTERIKRVFNTIKGKK